MDLGRDRLGGEVLAGKLGHVRALRLERDGDDDLWGISDIDLTVRTRGGPIGEVTMDGLTRRTRLNEPFR